MKWLAGRYFKDDRADLVTHHCRAMELLVKNSRPMELLVPKARLVCSFDFLGLWSFLFLYLNLGYRVRSGNFANVETFVPKSKLTTSHAIVGGPFSKDGAIGKEYVRFESRSSASRIDRNTTEQDVLQADRSDLFIWQVHWLRKDRRKRWPGCHWG